MHELSIAHALIDQVARHAPKEATVRTVRLQAGALQAIDPQAMQWAWKAATQDTDWDGSVLHLECLPWRMRCPQCDRTWESHDPLEDCACGCDRPHSCADHELTLLSLEVEDAFLSLESNQDRVAGPPVDGQEVAP